MQHYGPDLFAAAQASVYSVARRENAIDDIIQRSLMAARTHLGLQVAYLSQFVGNETVFRHVDAPGLEHMIKPGDRMSLDDVYCRHILAGRLPSLIPDTAKEPFAAALPITAAVPVGSHVSVPIRLRNGDVYGMFCCLGPSADETLNERDLNVMRCLADIAAEEVERNLAHDAELSARRARVEQVLADEALAIHYQPIWDIRSRRPIGFEALSRFVDKTHTSPAEWFEDAHQVGLGARLEMLAIAKALEGLARLPADTYLTVNSSPATAISAELVATLECAPLDRVVLELTEHHSIADMPRLLDTLRPLRRAGLRIAVDDAGAGYSGLQQILQLAPEIIKLDRFFVQSIEVDPVRRALAAALANFANAVGSSMIGEGVETVAELEALEHIGFEKVQGYLLGKPQPIDALELSYAPAS